MKLVITSIHNKNKNKKTSYRFEFLLSHDQVYCMFKWNGVTYVMSRTASKPTSINFNANWTQLKEGMMNEVRSDPSSENYFIGLENLHKLVSQASYRLRLSLSNGQLRAKYFYENFNIDSESSRYALSYTE